MLSSTPPQNASAGPAGMATVSCGNRNCELFQALFRASVNHNEGQTSGTVLRWDTRALLLGFK
jgi:hypothetical protein